MKATIELNGQTYVALGSEKAKGRYDAIVMGTGLTECIIGGLLSAKGKRVLQVEKNKYYGGESASLNVSQVVEKFEKRKATDEDFKALGQNYQTCIDQVPKFLMANGDLSKILIHTKVTNYVDFHAVDGSFVFRGSNQKPYKVPATASEALTSGLMGIFQKRRLRNFLTFVKDTDPKTLGEKTAGEIMTEYKLDENTQSFVGHAMALYQDDGYLTRSSARELVEKLRLYAYSLSVTMKSPYLYPLYGLGSIAEGFARLSAIHGEAIGGAFMLDQKDAEIVFEETSGRAIGVKVGDKAAAAPVVVGMPSYFPKVMTKRSRRVARAICLLDHPIANTESTGSSCMVILPADQVGKTGGFMSKEKYKPRTNDIYVTCVDSSFEVCAPGKYVAFVSTVMETEDPLKELQPGLDMLGKITKQFVETSTLLEPVNESEKTACYISCSLDATTHFQTVAKDVLRLYKNITGEDLDMSIKTDGVFRKD